VGREVMTPGTVFGDEEWERGFRKRLILRISEYGSGNNIPFQRL